MSAILKQRFLKAILKQRWSADVRLGQSRADLHTIININHRGRGTIPWAVSNLEARRVMGHYGPVRAIIAI